MSVTLTFKSGRLSCRLFARVRSLSQGALLGVALCAAVPMLALAQGTSRTAPAPQLAGRTSIATTTYASPEAAYDLGYGALRSGHPEMAIQAFEYAAKHDNLLAQFYLARIFSDNTAPYTNHGRAFELYQHIVTENADIDVDDDPLAPFVAKAMVALATYLRQGIPNSGVVPDMEQAVNLLRNAANGLRNEDAQFEYAKILLRGEGVAPNKSEALRSLHDLAQRGYAIAQAFLADLYWRGTHVKRDHTQALLLIDMAVLNAPSSDRIWIEDTYQYIFCGAGEGVRKQAQGAVADWRSKYVRPPEDSLARDGLTRIPPRPTRTCSNGELALPVRSNDPLSDAPRPRGATSGGTGYVAAPMPGAAVGGSTGFVQGNSGGFTLRDAGQLTLTPPR